MNVGVTGLNPACGIDMWVKKSTFESSGVFMMGEQKDKCSPTYVSSDYHQ
jgi:hypothetical protein